MVILACAFDPGHAASLRFRATCTGRWRGGRLMDQPIARSSPPSPIRRRLAAQQRIRKAEYARRRRGSGQIENHGHHLWRRQHWGSSSATIPERDETHHAPLLRLARLQVPRAARRHRLRCPPISSARCPAHVGAPRRSSPTDTKTGGGCVPRTWGISAPGCHIATPPPPGENQVWGTTPAVRKHRLNTDCHAAQPGLDQPLSRSRRAIHVDGLLIHAATRTVARTAVARLIGCR